MKFVYSDKMLFSCADMVSQLNNRVFPTPEFAKQKILETINSYRKNIRYVATGGFVLLFEEDATGRIHVEFLVDPYIVNLSKYENLPDVIFEVDMP